VFNFAYNYKATTNFLGVVQTKKKFSFYIQVHIRKCSIIHGKSCSKRPLWHTTL